MNSRPILLREYSKAYLLFVLNLIKLHYILNCNPLRKNPKVEISAMVGVKWIRLVGKLAVDPRPEARKVMLDANPTLNNMYKADDGVFEVLYFTEATALVYSFSEKPVEIGL
jgi:uncharacterized pyridoxamine 5'-phosphate oxidase family protein